MIPILVGRAMTTALRILGVQPQQESNDRNNQYSRKTANNCHPAQQRRLANIQRGNAMVSANEMASVIQHVLSQENASDAVTAARARLER